MTSSINQILANKIEPCFFSSFLSPYIDANRQGGLQKQQVIHWHISFCDVASSVRLHHRLVIEYAPHPPYLDPPRMLIIASYRLEVALIISEQYTQIFILFSPCLKLQHLNIEVYKDGLISLNWRLRSKNHQVTIPIQISHLRQSN